MKDILKLFVFGASQIVLVFAVPMFFTFFSEWISSTGFFGDVKCPEYRGCGVIGSDMSWGIRHYLYFWMCFFLFIANTARAIGMFVAYVEKVEQEKYQRRM